MSVITVEFREKFPKLRYTLLGYDKLRYEHDWQSIEHTHPFCEILIITNGRGNFINSAQATPIRRGNVIITNPNILHTEQSCGEDDAALEYVAISVSGVFFTDNKSEGFFRSSVFDLEPRWANITDLLSHIDSEIARKEIFWQSSVQNLIEELLIILSRASSIASVSPRKDAPRGKGTQFVPLIQQYLEHYYAGNITLEDLSQRFFVNKFYLLKCFKKITGTTPILYLENVRIKKAQSLLTTTNFSVMNISQQVGFANSSYFSKRFRAITGMTPTQYAKQYHKQPAAKKRGRKKTEKA